MADGNIILSAAKIVESDAARRYVVVSAPGKRFSGDIKVTDLLYQASAQQESGDLVGFEETFEKISARFLSIEREIGKNLGVQAALDEMKVAMLGGAGKDYCVSRGEFVAAHIMAAVLDVPFVDATEFVRFNEDGTLSEETFALASEVLKQYPRAVVPGFYGLGFDGKVKTFSTMVGLCVMMVFSYGWLNWTITGIIVATTLYSGVEYFVQNWNVIKP